MALVVHLGQEVAVGRRRGAQSGYDPNSLMAGDHWALEGKVAQAAVCVVVQVGAAEADREHPHLDLACTGGPDRALLYPQVLGTVQDGGGLCVEHG
jgi:hypothetical protein